MFVAGSESTMVSKLRLLVACKLHFTCHGIDNIHFEKEYNGNGNRFSVFIEFVNGCTYFNLYRRISNLRTLVKKRIS